VGLTTLRLLRDKGLISQAEFDRALSDIAETSGARGGNDTTLVVSKFAATLYGFVEADAIWDSTQSFTDVAGNTLIAPATTATGAPNYAGSHSRAQFGIRNSRFGIRLQSPSTAWFRASGVIEADFEGATLPVGSGQPYLGTEAAFFNNPTFRLRNAYVRFETPVVDILVGQFWHLFGWSGNYVGNSVNITGIVGQVLNRTAQIRLSHTFRSEAVSFELGVAALRPPQRNSGTPEGAAGFQLAFPKWSGMQTISSAGTRIAPASIAVTGDVRKLSVAEFAAAPTTARSVNGQGVAVDAFIPVIPATADKKGNSLSLNGEFTYSLGMSDLFTGLTGGVANPALPNPTMATPAPSYTPDIDPGLAMYYATPGAQNGVTLGAVQWTTFNVGLEYYFPGLDGRLWISGNYFRTSSSNTSKFLGVAADAAQTAIDAAKAKVRSHEQFADVNVFGDPYPGVRFGLGYANIADTYLNGTTATNHRVQFSGFYIF